jgi:hypothetical protein
LYWYAYGDPLDLTDPSGKSGFSISVPDPISIAEDVSGEVVDNLEESASQVGDWVSDAPGVLSGVWATVGPYVDACLSNAIPDAVIGGGVGAVEGAGVGVVPGAIGGGAAGCGQGLLGQGLRDAGQDELAEAAEIAFAAGGIYGSGRLLLREWPELPQAIKEVGEIFR